MTAPANNVNRLIGGANVARMEAPRLTRHVAWDICYYSEHAFRVRV
jgi:hypothetical protein